MDGADRADGAPGTHATGRVLGRALLLVALAGVIAAVAGAWRPGIAVVGLALVVAAVVRVLAPARPLGTLALRAGWLDATFLTVVGVTLIAMAIAIP